MHNKEQRPRSDGCAGPLKNIMPKGVYVGNSGRPKGAKDKRPRMIAPTFEGEMTEQMAFRCTPEQRRRLEAFAGKHGISITEALRRMIDRL